MQRPWPALRSAQRLLAQFNPAQSRQLPGRGRRRPGIYRDCFRGVRAMSVIALTHIHSRTRELAPGFVVSLIVAAAASFLSEHYGAPVMLFALLLGMALNFLASDGACKAGIEFTARTVLR